MRPLRRRQANCLPAFATRKLQLPPPCIGRYIKVQDQVFVLPANAVFGHLRSLSFFQDFEQPRLPARPIALVI
jgi:hypothetical protein